MHSKIDNIYACGLEYNFILRLFFYIWRTLSQSGRALITVCTFCTQTYCVTNNKINFIAVFSNYKWIWYSLLCISWVSNNKKCFRILQKITSFRSWKTSQFSGDSVSPKCHHKWWFCLYRVRINVNLLWKYNHFQILIGLSSATS